MKQSIREVIVVEGRYDKNTLSQIVDATIVETGGFAVFRDREKQAMLRTLAEKRGLILLTDSDGGGLVIRNFLRGIVPKEYIKNAYIPDVEGKEKRKSSPSKEGKLGVEGMEPEVLLSALRRAGATFEGEVGEKGYSRPITKADLYRLGLSGGADSAAKRRALQKSLALPEKMSANSLLQVLNIITTKAELEELLSSDPA
ncbi:MAG: toprim domain-containing protein [Oscillospiraceae bacterium]